MSETSQGMVHNLYDLPTYQRRLRHLRSLAVRNLLCKSCHGKDIAKLMTYFTLHTEEKRKEFYKSEVIVGSLNPTWQSFDIRKYEDEVDIQARSVIVRLWVCNSSENQKFRLLMDWSINLSGLVFFAEKLQQGKLKYGSNMMIVGMFDKYFKAPEEALPAEDDTLMVEPSTIRNSYTINSLSRIHTVLRAIKQMQASVKRVHRSIEDKLLSSQERSRKLTAQEDLLMKVALLRSELTWQTSKLQQEREVHEKLIQERKDHSASLQKRFAEVEADKESLQEKRKQYFQTRESYIKENAQLLIRRKQLIGELTTCIYPITETEKKELCILNVKLPNSESFQGRDEVMLSVSLGYTCHLVTMMSYILDFPLRYSMEYKGSRSQIMDHVHPKLTDKDRTFPLYSKGREKFQFNYGVFLLNKNISQLRFYCGLGTTELRLTLPNIKTMLELRLGVKFDDHGALLSLPEHKGRASNPSNEKADTSSSLASGGRVSATDPEQMALEENLSQTKKLQNDVLDQRKESKSKDDVPISLATIRKQEFDEKEDLFKGSDDGFFQQVKSSAPDQNSIGTSSCDSFGDRANGESDIPQRTNYREFSPMSDGNSLTVQCADSKSVHSNSSLSCDMSLDDANGLQSSVKSQPNCDISANGVSDSGSLGNDLVADLGNQRNGDQTTDICNTDR